MTLTGENRSTSFCVRVHARAHVSVSASGPACACVGVGNLCTSESRSEVPGQS
jgi:hypothetical protein